eukprot:574417-Pleurochrysis_carterae.AAC.1
MSPSYQCALTLCALSFQSTPSAWPTSPPAPSTEDRLQACSAPAPELAPKAYLLVICTEKYVPARPDGSNSSKVINNMIHQRPPGSGVHGLRELV